jgi:hypothetical protein
VGAVILGSLPGRVIIARLGGVIVEVVDLFLVAILSLGAFSLAAKRSSHLK